MAFLGLALPVALTEGAVLLGEMATPIISTIGSGITSVLAFTGAGTLINEASEAIKASKAEVPKEDIKLPKDITKESFINQNPAIMKKEVDLRKLMNRSLQNL